MKNIKTNPKEMKDMYKQSATTGFISMMLYFLGIPLTAFVTFALFKININTLPPDILILYKAGACLIIICEIYYLVQMIRWQKKYNNHIHNAIRSIQEKQFK